MKWIGERPGGIVLVAILLALNGITSLVTAALRFPDLTAVASALIGLALLHRAYGIWNFERGAWLITVFLLGLRAILTLLDVLTAPTIVDWIGLAVVVVSLVYLTQPSIRSLFAHPR